MDRRGEAAMTVGTPVAEVRNVSKRFGATRALDALTLGVARGESRALVGRNGAGKSTLVSILTGLVQADRGEVCFAGRPAPAPGNRAGWQERVACVFQKSTLFPELTVAENLYVNAYPGQRGGFISWKQLHAKADRALREWGIEVSPATAAGRLRVEDRQQVEIARALEAGSRFLILDEPTAQLGAPAINQLFARIQALRRAGVSILYISHHLDEIYEVCDTVSVLRDGRLVHSGDLEGLGKRDLVAAMLGDDDEAEATASNGQHQSRRSVQANGVGGLRVDEVSIDGWCSDISLQVRPGELVGLAGLAGSGKTQVAAAIAGLEKPSSGQIRVDDQRVPPGDVSQAISHGVGFVPQDRHADGFAPNLSIEENLTLSLLDRLGRLGLVDSRRRRQLAEGASKSLEIVAAGPDQLVSELSGGNQQKVVVGRALLTKPRVLVVVTPTAGVDVGAKGALFKTLTELDDVAVLVVSDELDELSHCDRVLVMFRGHLTKEFESWGERDLVAAMEGVEET